MNVFRLSPRLSAEGVGGCWLTSADVGREELGGQEVGEVDVSDQLRRSRVGQELSNALRVCV